MEILTLSQLQSLVHMPEYHEVTPLTAQSIRQIEGEILESITATLEAGLIDLEQAAALRLTLIQGCIPHKELFQQGK